MFIKHCNSCKFCMMRGKRVYCMVHRLYMKFPRLEATFCGLYNKLDSEL